MATDDQRVLDLCEQLLKEHDPATTGAMLTEWKRLTTGK